MSSIMTAIIQWNVLRMKYLYMHLRFIHLKYRTNLISITTLACMVTVDCGWNHVQLHINGSVT